MTIGAAFYGELAARMETPPVESAHSAEETSTQKQVRLRRERREAKIKAGGSARLERITNLSGRPAEPGI